MKTFITLLFIGFIATTTSAVATNVEGTFSESKPIKECFKYLRVQRQSKGTIISWAVSSKDVVHFIIERSIDGKSFEPKTDMNCSGVYLHSFIDKNAVTGPIYYKIAAIKSDGTKEYSVIQTINTIKG